MLDIAENGDTKVLRLHYKLLIKLLINARIHSGVESTTVRLSLGKLHAESTLCFNRRHVYVFEVDR